MSAIDRIRAALETASELVPAMFATHAKFEDGLAALAELEKSSGRSYARMSWEICGCQTPPTHYVGTMPCPLNPTPPPVKPAPQFVAGEVDDAMAQRIAETVFGQLGEGRVCADDGRKMIAAVRSELGPTLGMVEIREPDDEQYRAIADEFLCNVATASRGVRTGRAMFNAVRAVMWPKEGL